MALTIQQKEYIIGFILGDSFVEKNGPNCRIRFDHSRKQLEYVKWKHQLLLPHSGKLTLYQVSDPRQKDVYKGCRFYTYTREYFNLYRRLFYPQGRKIIPPQIGDLLTARGLAVWFLDDGSRRTGGVNFFLHTDSYTLEECGYLQQALRHNFSIESALRRTHSKNKSRPADRGFCLYITDQSALTLKSLVQPLVEKELPNFLYKLVKPRND